MMTKKHYMRIKKFSYKLSSKAVLVTITEPTLNILAIAFSE